MGSITLALASVRDEVMDNGATAWHVVMIICPGKVTYLST